MLELVSLRCPYCGEPLNAALDRVADARDFESDCPVCFCPVRFRITPVIDGRFLRVRTLRAHEPHPAA